MKNHNAPRSIQEHISIQQVGTETLVYDEQRHKAFCLNEVSSIIWRLADGEHTVAQISAAASLQLKAAVNEEIVLFALEELRRDGLIEPLSTSEIGLTVSRRAMLRRLAVGGAMLLPVVAAIVAPTAAQAYSGCFDCDDSQPAQVNQSARAKAKHQQLNRSNALSPIPYSNAPTFSPYMGPGIGQPIDIDPKLQQ